MRINLFYMKFPYWPALEMQGKVFAYEKHRHIYQFLRYEQRTAEARVWSLIEAATDVEHVPAVISNFRWLIAPDGHALNPFGDTSRRLGRGQSMIDVFLDP